MQTITQWVLPLSDLTSKPIQSDSQRALFSELNNPPTPTTAKIIFSQKALFYPLPTMELVLNRTNFNFGFIINFFNFNSTSSSTSTSETSTSNTTTTT